MAKRSEKRSRFFVDSGVQGALTRQLVIHWLLVGTITFSYLLIMQLFSTGFDSTVSATLGMMWEKYGLLAVVLTVLSPVFIYDSVKLSNRFAGPMVSFRTALSRLAKGEQVGQLRFRRGDFWREFAEDFNSVAKRMRQLDESVVVGDDDGEVLESRS